MTAETAGREDLKLLKQAIEALTKDDKSIEGIQALKKAIEINPRLAKAHQLLAMYYMGVQDGELAKKHFEILRSLDKKLTQQLLDTQFGPFFERGVNFISDGYSGGCWYCQKGSYDRKDLMTLYKKWEGQIDGNINSPPYDLKTVSIPKHNNCEIKAKKVDKLTNIILYTGIIIGIVLSLAAFFTQLASFLAFCGIQIFAIAIIVFSFYFQEQVGKSYMKKLGITACYDVGYPEIKELLSKGYKLGMPPMKY
jgi:hypothetical protein